MKQTPPHIACTDLSSIEPGRRVRIAGVEKGNNVQGRLLAMGFIKEAEVSIILNHGKGPLIVGLGESRITIGRGMAKKILVR